MTPEQFVAKWSQIQQKETAVSQSHFNDICRLVGHPTPLEYDPAGMNFSLEIQTAKAVELFMQAVFDKVTRKSVAREQTQELDDIHTQLDTAVLDAYGWPHDLSDEKILEHLLALNLQRAAVQEKRA